MFEWYTTRSSITPTVLNILSTSPTLVRREEMVIHSGSFSSRFARPCLAYLNCNKGFLRFKPVSLEIQRYLGLVCCAGLSWYCWVNTRSCLESSWMLSATGKNEQGTIDRTRSGFLDFINPLPFLVTLRWPLVPRIPIADLFFKIHPPDHVPSYIYECRTYLIESHQYYRSSP